MSPTVFQAAVLGIVQGLGEFLPISSSAHLVLVPRYFGWGYSGLAFDVALHLGTLAAVVAYFWKDLWQYAEAWLRWRDPHRAEARRTGLQLIAATIPGAIAGFLLEDKAETVFRSPSLIAMALIALGCLLALADWLCSGKRTVKDLTIGTAVALGLAQSLALIPGVSRSGITITAALALGMQRSEAARFSFLMSVPIIAGAGVLKVKDILSASHHLPTVVGFIAAAISGLAAIAFLMRYVQRHRYTPFILYRWVLGAFVLANLAHFQ